MAYQEEKINHISYSHTSFLKQLSAWWFYFTTPPEPPTSAPLEERERFRRARLSSVIIFLLIVLSVPSLPASIIGTNPIMLPMLGILLLTTLIAAYFNRKGMVTIAGLIIVFSFTPGIMINIATTPGGLSLQLLPLFSILVVPEILTAALLPSAFVFVSACINTLFCLLAVRYMPAHPSIYEYLNLAYAYGIFLPATLQGIIAGISFLWARSLGRALRERDRAEEVARLERDLSEQSITMLQLNSQLNYSIDLIVQTQSRVANGDLNARVPLTPDNVLWSVAGSLNNLISRLQRLQTIEEELYHTKTNASHLTSILRNNKLRRPNLPYQCNGTIIDSIALEIFRSEPSSTQESSSLRLERKQTTVQLPALPKTPTDL